MNIHYCSCLTLEECKDITLGDCHIREEYIIQSIQAPTVAICQEACFLFADCKNFNFTQSFTEFTSDQILICFDLILLVPLLYRNFTLKYHPTFHEYFCDAYSAPAQEVKLRRGAKFC